MKSITKSVKAPKAAPRAATNAKKASGVAKMPIKTQQSGNGHKDSVSLSKESGAQEGLSQISSLLDSLGGLGGAGGSGGTSEPQEAKQPSQEELVRRQTEDEKAEQLRVLLDILANFKARPRKPVANSDLVGHDGLNWPH